MPMTSSITAAPRIVGTLTGAQRPKLHQRLRGDADTGGCQDRPDEDGFPVQRQAEQDRRGNTTGHRQRDAAEGGPEGHLPDAPHPGEVRFEPRHEHEQDDADIRQVTDDGEKVWCGMSDPGSGVANNGHPSTFSTVGPRIRPARISPNTDGCPILFASAPASLAAATTSARISSSCSEWVRC